MLSRTNVDVDTRIGASATACSVVIACASWFVFMFQSVTIKSHERKNKIKKFDLEPLEPTCNKLTWQLDEKKPAVRRSSSVHASTASDKATPVARTSSVTASKSITEFEVVELNQSQSAKKKRKRPTNKFDSSSASSSSSSDESDCNAKSTASAQKRTNASKQSKRTKTDVNSGAAASLTVSDRAKSPRVAPPAGDSDSESDVPDVDLWTQPGVVAKPTAKQTSPTKHKNVMPESKNKRLAVQSSHDVPVKTDQAVKSSAVKANRSSQAVCDFVLRNNHSFHICGAYNV